MSLRAVFSKQMLFRLMAVALSLSPLLAAEGVCRLAGWGQPTSLDDPFVGFSDVHPLFVSNDETGRHEIAGSRLTHFCAESFATDKPKDTYRVFVLGGSTVQGAPYEPATSFTDWLELSLRAAYPERAWEVVNCGGTSYASYRLVPILQEVLGHEPDLVIVCSGHNEFLEDRSYASVKHAPGLIAWPRQQLARLRVYNVLRSSYLAITERDEPPPERDILPTEADAWLDWRDGLEQYHRDEDWVRGVVGHYEFNLRRMESLCRQADVPMMLVCPVSNLDFPPFKSEQRPGLDEHQEQSFADLLDQAMRLMQQGSELEALQSLTSAEQIDDRYARMYYLKGKCHQRVGQLDEARAAFLRAIEEDICPLRMTPDMMEIVRSVAEDTGRPFVDAHEVLAAVSPGGITGPRWLVDHVHPTIEGHQQIADALLHELAREMSLQPVAGWQEVRARAYTEQIAGLHPSYFPRGQQRLHGLKLWTSGRVRFERGRPRVLEEETPPDVRTQQPSAGKEKTS